MTHQIMMVLRNVSTAAGWVGIVSTSEDNANCSVIQRQTVKKEMGEDILNLSVPDTDRVKTFVTFPFCV